MMPSSQAIVINLVPAEAFGNAVALSSSSFQLAVILGPAPGGSLYLAGASDRLGYTQLRQRCLDFPLS